MAKKKSQKQQKPKTVLAEEPSTLSGPLTIEQFLGHAKRSTRVRSKSPIKRAMDSVASHTKKAKDVEDPTTLLPFSQEFLSKIAMDPAVLTYLSTVNSAQEAADQNKENVEPKMANASDKENVIEMGQDAEVSETNTQMNPLEETNAMSEIPPVI
jgi:hypothetical protein